MVKDRPRLGHIAAMVLFTLSCFGILLFLWLSFGGSIPLRAKSYRFTAAVPEAATLVQEADVRLAGVNIGKVKKKELDKGGARTLVEFEIKPKYAPIPKDTKAILRQKTLLGETYVELTSGHARNGMLPDGGTLNPRNVRSTVELDEIFRIFDKPTREAFQRWVQEGSVVVAGNYAQDFNDALGNLAPFATDGSKLLRILDDQGIAVRRLIKHTGRVFNAVAAEDGQLRGLITNGNATFRALALHDRALADTFLVFPTFLRETRVTLARLDRFSANAHPLVNDLKGPADDLAPTLRDVRGLSPHLEKLFHDLNPLIRASRTGLPAGTRFIKGAEPTLEAVHALFPELNPVLAYLSFQRDVVAAFLTDGGPALAGNANGGYVAGNGGGGHYLPQIAMVDPTSFMRFTTRPTFDRGNAYIAPNAYQRARPLGITESFDCDASGGEQPNPNDNPLTAAPPCFVQPPLLFQLQQFPRLVRGRAPIVPAPIDTQGTRPATP
jgi:phospholipid/cholesterol/gamma-HCH transport system substrate-binding protein